MTLTVNLPLPCPFCGCVIDHEAIPKEEPAFQILAPKATVMTVDYAAGIGRAIGRLLWIEEWPRRKLLNRLHHRVDVKIDQGLQLLTPDFDVIDFHESYLDETMPKEPTHKWLLDFARRCERGLARSPSNKLYRHLSRIDLALKSTGLKPD